MTPSTTWVRGDTLGLDLPADPATLREGGEDFLTQAFRATGLLAADNRVARISQFEECTGGSTGRKLLLTVEYAQADPDLQRELFVKFSRDLDDPIRDRGRSQMAPEVRFALLSRQKEFPIRVPACAFADYHADSGTGVLITERIAYGQGAIEAQYDKCRDDVLPEPLEHYRTLLAALARLAAADRTGRLPPDLAERFPFDLDSMTVGRRAPYTAQQLLNRVARYAGFCDRHPELLPAAIRAPAFIERLHDDVLRLSDSADAIRAELQSDSAHIALCHWNANIDNAWFWRDRDGRLQCGLMDWGCVGRMNLAMALWGVLSAASTELLDAHLDTLIAHFIEVYATAGAPPLDCERLKRQMLLYAALMGVTWLLDAPAYIEAQRPQLTATSRPEDAAIRDNDIVRVQRQMLSNMLSLWARHDIGQWLKR